MRKALCAALISVFCPFLSAQQAPFLLAQQTPYLGAQQGLSNDSIIKMVSAQLSDDVIVSTINASPGAYDTSPDGLVALKQAGVSDKVIATLVAKSGPDPSSSAATSAQDASAPAAALPSGVENIGAYYKDSDGSFKPLPSEGVVFQSGGLIKHFASAGLMKQDLNGLIGGMRSRLVVSTPVTFVLHVPQGHTASDYELVRLHVVGNNRQFQSLAGGLNQASGSIRDEIDFSSTQIAPGAWQIVLNNGLGDGEFGFLEPQDSSSPKTPPTTGKIFTFAIVD